MAEGYGFAGEGDWKTAALVRAMKVMAAGLDGGTSFMEDYTYHLSPDGMKVLGAHMLEICPTLAATRPRLEVHPLGDRAARPIPVRLVFDAKTGPGGQRVGRRDGRPLPHDRQHGRRGARPTRRCPKLPVARRPLGAAPDLKTSAAAWIHAGGAHHTGFSFDLTPEHLADFAEMAGMEFLLIDGSTTVPAFKKELAGTTSTTAWPAALSTIPTTAVTPFPPRHGMTAVRSSDESKEPAMGRLRSEDARSSGGGEQPRSAFQESARGRHGESRDVEPRPRSRGASVPARRRTAPPRPAPTRRPLMLEKVKSRTRSGGTTTASPGPPPSLALTRTGAPSPRGC
jgi:hypothetical protein